MVHEILAVPEARFRSHHGWGCILGKVARPRCYSKANKYHKKRLFLCPRTFPTYWHTGPDDGEIGPRQRPFRLATGSSWLGHHTVNSPFVTRTSTMRVLVKVSG
jgi:hypothetical protein